MGREAWAVVVAGGAGLRFGAAKQFVPLHGKPVLAWALAAARTAVSGVVLVLPESAVDLSDWSSACDDVVVGAATRAGSVRAGLAAVPSSAEIVVIHDAARPLATPSLFAAVIAAVEAGAAGAIPGVPLADTVKRVAESCVVETLDRSELIAVQTPQAFDAAVLRRAHLGAPEATDDAGLLEKIGEKVAVVPGESTNVKLTSPADLAMLEVFVDALVMP